jgi:hypothetical protein
MAKWILKSDAEMAMEASPVYTTNPDPPQPQVESARGMEDRVCDKILPVNSLAMLSRLKQVIQERNTNTLLGLQNSIAVRKLMWLLNSQVYGETVNIDMESEWKKLCEVV